MADQKLTDLTATTAPILTDIAYIVTDPGGAKLSRKATLLNIVAGSLLTMQLINEIKGFPSVAPNDADLDTLNLWWDSVGTPTTKVSFVDVAGEGGVTETYKYCLKCVTDAASEGFYQRYTYADEPRMKLGRTVSALVAIWSVGAINITAKLLNSDASETSAAAVSAAAWTIVEVPAHVLAGTYVDLQITAGAAGTFYVVPLGLCIGARGIPLPPRPSRYVDDIASTIVNGVDPGGSAGIDVDCTAVTSNLCHKVDLIFVYVDLTTASKHLYARRNGATNWRQILYNETAAKYYNGMQQVPVDDSQIFEYKTDGAAGDGESVFINLYGYWEWA